MCHSKNRSGFTLMEMMISVVLIVLITLFLSEAITSMQRANISLKKHDDVENNRSKIFNTFYMDLLSAKDFKVLPTKERQFHVIQMQTLNSLYNISYPYVTYYVNANTNNLIRLESAYPISLPITYERRYSVKANDILRKVSDFNLYLSARATESNVSKKETNTSVASPTSYELLYLNAESLKSPILLEMSKP